MTTYMSHKSIIHLVVRLVMVPALILLWLAGGYAGLTAQEVTPAQFQWIAETSVNISQACKHYLKEITRYSPYAYVDYNNLLTPGYEYQVDTPAGLWDVGPIQGTLGFYGGYKSFGLLGVIQGINLLIADEYKQGAYASLTGWGNYYYVLGLRARLFGIDSLIGVSLKQTPYFVEDNGELKFGAYIDGNGVFQTNSNELESITSFEFRKFSLESIFNFSQLGFSTLRLGGPIWSSPPRGQVEVSARYHRLNSTVKVGVEYSDWEPVPALVLGARSLFSVYSSQPDFSIVDEIALHSTWSLLKKRVQEEDQEEKAGFFINLRGGISLSKQLYPEYLFGFLAELSLNNLRFGSFDLFLLASVSMNYQETLNQLPLPHQLLISIKTRMLFG